MPRPTLSDIAQRLGISKMTVSRALRDERHVEATLRERILQTAHEMGYRPDPEIAKLMSHMRRSRRHLAPRTLAFVWAERDLKEIQQSPWSKELVRGAHTRAAQLGFQLEEFFLAAKGMTGRRLSDILEARGIPGLLLSPLLSRSRGHVSMRWERFSSVVIGLGYARPALHRVHHHHFLGMMTAMRMLKKLGYRRIGFFSQSTVDERMFGAWSASFLSHHPLPQRQAVNLLHLLRTPNRKDFLEWIATARPEVVIDSGNQLHDWLQEAKLAKPPDYVTLSRHSEQADITGIDQQADVLGGAAIDLLVAQFQQNERGIPEHPKIVLTEGVWVPGGTIRKVR